MSVAAPTRPLLALPPAVRRGDRRAPAGGAALRGTVGGRRWVFYVACVLVGVPFYLSGQDWTTSRSEAFTETADEMEATASGGNALRQAAFLTLGGVGLWALLHERRRRKRSAPTWWPAGWPGGLLAYALGEVAGIARRAHPVAWCLGVYLAWCFGSLLWSHDPGTTVRKLAVLGCWSVAALGVARALSGRRVVWIGVLLPAVYLTIGLLAELSQGTFRPWGGEYRFAGTMHPNTQGLTLASLICGAFVLWRSNRRAARLGAGTPVRHWLLPLAGLAVVCLLLTKSRTSAAGLVLCAGLLAAIATPPRWRLAAVVGGGFVGSGFLFLSFAGGGDPLGAAAGAATMGRNEQLGSLTGRHEIWAEVGRFTSMRPWAGWGYDSFWTPPHVAEVSENVGWGLRESHSAYRDVLLGTGKIGLLLLVPALLWAWLAACLRYAKAERLADRGVGPGDPLAGFVGGTLAVGLLNGFTESAMSMVLFTPFVICCGLAKLYVFPDPTCGGPGGFDRRGGDRRRGSRSPVVAAPPPVVPAAAGETR